MRNAIFFYPTRTFTHSEWWKSENIHIQYNSNSIFFVSSLFLPIFPFLSLKKNSKMKHEKKVVAKKHQNTHQSAAANSLSTSQSIPATSSNPQSTTLVGKPPNKQQSVPAKHLFSESAIRNNFQVLEQSRTCQAAVSGIASGILGLTGALGFLFYFLCIFIQAFIWDYKAGFQWANFFPTRWLLISHALVGGLFTYVLFWVFVYGLVHVY